MPSPVPVVPRYSDDPDWAHETFARSLATIHGLRSIDQVGAMKMPDSATYRQIPDPADKPGLAESETRAMVRAYLGHDYDESRVELLVEDQRCLQLALSDLLDSYERGDINATRYAEEVNSMSAYSAATCLQILGADDFHRLFGEVPNMIIDPGEFASQEAARHEVGEDSPGDGLYR